MLMRIKDPRLDLGIAVPKTPNPLVRWPRAISLEAQRLPSQEACRKESGGRPDLK